MKKSILFFSSICMLLSACMSEITEPLYDNTLEGADYWSDKPEILSAGLGFSDIVAADTDELSEEYVKTLGGAWLSDLSCGDSDNASIHTSASTKNQVESAFIGELNDDELIDALALDGLPVVFSWPVLTGTVNPTDFLFTLNTGELVTPMYAGMVPNWEYNERNVIVVFGEFGNKIKSTDSKARFPVKCEIVEDDTPLMLVGENAKIVSAVGLTWTTTTNPYDTNNGPRLVGAKLNYCGENSIGEGMNGSFYEKSTGYFPNDEFALYGGGDFRLRMLTTGGFSPDGIRGVRPDMYENFFRIHVKGEDSTSVTLDKIGVEYKVLGGVLKVIGLSDLGKLEGGNIIYNECYSEDQDNYIDIIIEGDTAAARNITYLEIPSLTNEYSAFYNPGGPGTTPFEGVAYSSPGPLDLEPVIIALDNPMRVSYNPE